MFSLKKCKVKKINSFNVSAKGRVYKVNKESNYKNEGVFLMVLKRDKTRQDCGSYPTTKTVLVIFPCLKTLKTSK